jgi:hypothetical protein
MIEENSDEKNYYGRENGFHGLIIVPDCMEQVVQ